MKKVALVLSGGGARGAAHLGILQLLEEMQIPISAISGVSAGAVIGALYACGYNAQQALEQLKKLSYLSLKDLQWGGVGIFHLNNLKSLLISVSKHNDFAELKIPLTVAATDIVNCKPVYINSGTLADSVIASASVPVVYEPVVINNISLSDGGLMDNLPVSPLLNKYDIILGSHVNKLSHDINLKDFTKLNLIERCFHLVIAASVEKSAQYCNLLLEPELKGFGMFQMKDADKIFEIGYNHAKKYTAEIEKLYSA